MSVVDSMYSTIGLNWEMSRPNQRVEINSGLHQRARESLLQMHHRSGVGHLGGNLSVLDLLLTACLQAVEHQDTLILSKGHAAGALYVCLKTIGVLTSDDLATFHQEETKLPGHPPVNIFKEIPFATGSLGHGLSLAVGAALGDKLVGRDRNTVAILSDGELQEGSTLEALNFLAHNSTLRLTVIIDNNGWQGFGRLSDTMGMTTEIIKNRIEALELPCVPINGHDLEQVYEAIRPDPGHAARVILAQTIKGQGLERFADTLESHYEPISDDDLVSGLETIKAGNII